jgi:hypothetical protein
MSIDLYGSIAIVICNHNIPLARPNQQSTFLPHKPITVDIQQTQIKHASVHLLTYKHSRIELSFQSRQHNTVSFTNDEKGVIVWLTVSNETINDKQHTYLALQSVVVSK